MTTLEAVEKIDLLIERFTVGIHEALYLISECKYVIEVNRVTLKYFNGLSNRYNQAYEKIIRNIKYVKPNSDTYYLLCDIRKHLKYQYNKLLLVDAIDPNITT